MCNAISCGVVKNSISTWVLIGIIFSTYFIVCFVYKKLGIHNLQKALGVTNGLPFLNLKHFFGIVLFGILSYAMMPEFRYLIEQVEIPKLYVLIPFIVILFLSIYTSYLGVQKQVLIFQTQTIYYNISNAWGYFIIRFTYLLCYEFFFRGIILFKLLELTNLTLAILINTVLYLLIHIFDSKKELLGVVPFGIILCLFTYYANSVWYAFLIHLSLSVVYEISIFYYLTIKNKVIS